MNCNNRNILFSLKETMIFRFHLPVFPPCRQTLFKLMSFLIFLFTCTNSFSQQNIRKDISLNDNWLSVADDRIHAYDGFEKAQFNTGKWTKVDVPHNWDQYEGYRRKLHGNRHGYAWYRKVLPAINKEKNKRYFLFFEGVGSYATVWVNGKQVGYHAGGRTSFTIDVTDALNNGFGNLIAVRADHPAFIQDLPWVCGGCSSERGFSEGSQPMGIFRPVHLIVTPDLRVEPFGIHAWNDATVSERSATIRLSTSIKNYSEKAHTIELVSIVMTAGGKPVTSSSSTGSIEAGRSIEIAQEEIITGNVHLWSPDDPYLYKIITKIIENGKVIDSIVTPYGIRWISWPIGKAKSSNQFFINGKPFFINGIAEYEHLFGNSHAFSNEEIKARVKQIKAAGFNAFRDGHQPHNLLYQRYWDELGILSWTQLSAHVWFDTPAFREHFKQLLKEWVIERRNSPSVVLWGLQNESKLPADFAKECTELIRSLDPTASSQRLVTTCNGGEGTDWDVPQNWTGTYGGDPSTYAADLKKQILVGEYGAWRTLGLHTEGPFQQNGVLSEDRMTQLIEQKIRLSESAKDSCAGHFFWLYNSHDNPGRVQGGEGFRELDRIGPVNYKGLLTSWGEPTDVFELFRSNYGKEPMVYIVSHTWPERWTKPGIKNNITVYSNCEEVELFNDVDSVSLSKRKKNGIGSHFQWDSVNIKYNLLYAVGYINGKPVAKDTVLLYYLEDAPRYQRSLYAKENVAKDAEGYNYLYRVNCGGGGIGIYENRTQQFWQADNKRREKDTWGSSSWTDVFKDMPAYFASQRSSNEPVKGTSFPELFNTYRYGRDKLKYEFPVANGDYLVELYFAEPWWGRGGGMDCSGFRLFDVAINDKTVIKDLDIWKEAGYSTALKKSFKVHVSNGRILISFPKVKAGEALIAGIAIATPSKKIFPADGSPMLITGMDTHNNGSSSWLNTGDEFSDSEKIVALPPNLYGAEWFVQPDNVYSQQVVSFQLSRKADVFIGIDESKKPPQWMNGFENTGTILTTTERKYLLYRKRFEAGSLVKVKKNNDGVPLPVIVNEVSAIEPAYDFKAVKSYRAAEAKLSANIGKAEAVNGKVQAVVNDDAEAITTWSFSTGVGDEYSITIKYNSSYKKPLEGQLQLSASDGTVLKKEKIIFTETKEGKWNYVSTSTGGMINAGTYQLKLSVSHAKGLVLNSVDIQ